MTDATLSQIHEFFADGFVIDEDGKKSPKNGYSLTDFRNDWKALNVDEKAWFKAEVGAVLAA